MEFNPNQKNGTITLLLADDSKPFRNAFMEMLADVPEITAIGTASNGIKALELILKFRPTVIVMELEMPLMDGMTALQHLMIHVPTPTIMISGLTPEGVPRAFDSLKNGAVDFVHKGSFSKDDTTITDKEYILNKIKNACRISVNSLLPSSPLGKDFFKSIKKRNTVLFCEECGSRIVVGQSSMIRLKSVVCKSCGELLDLEGTQKHRRVNLLAVLSAGKGTYANILKIVPQISHSIHGSIIIMLEENPAHLDLFVQYLDSISYVDVRAIEDDLILAAGTCYVGCAKNRTYMSSYKSDYTLKLDHSGESNGSSAFDTLMGSVSTIFKNRLIGTVISGTEEVGVKGLKVIQENGGMTFLLNPNRCMHRRMADYIISQMDINIVADEKTLSRNIQKMFEKTKRSIVTA